MDFFFHPCDNKSKCIILELKIDAEDKEKQLYRYKEFVKDKYEDYLIYYLTLNGKLPSSNSIGDIPKSKLKCISFDKHILLLLDKCINICNYVNIDYTSIYQYKLLVQKITGDKMKKKYSELIQTKEELEAAFMISESLNDLKGIIIYNFMNELKKQFEGNGYYTTLEDLECAKEYYRKPVIPYLTYDIAVVEKNAESTLHLCLEIAIEYDIYACWILYEEKNDEWTPVDINKVKKENIKLYNKLVKILEKELCIEIKENRYLSLYWKYLIDVNGKQFGVKQFSNCIQLYDNNIFAESERIANELSVSIGKLQRIDYEI